MLPACPTRARRGDRLKVDWRRLLVVELALLAGCALLVVIAWVVGQIAHTVLLALMGVVVAFVNVLLAAAYRRLRSA